MCSNLTAGCRGLRHVEVCMASHKQLAKEKDAGMLCDLFLDLPAGSIASIVLQALRKLVHASNKLEEQQQAHITFQLHST